MARLTTDLSARLWSDGICTRWMTIRGFAYLTNSSSSSKLFRTRSRRYLCESFPGCLGPCHGGSAECTCLFLPPRHRPSPVHYRGRLPACTRQNDFMTDPFSRLQPFRYVQAPRFARLPYRSYRCDLSPQGSRGFYVRAEHASLPPHASDMLTTRCDLKVAEMIV
jgi:hypothetical protein